MLSYHVDAARAAADAARAAVEKEAYQKYAKKLLGLLKKSGT